MLGICVLCFCVKKVICFNCVVNGKECQFKSMCECGFIIDFFKVEFFYVDMFFFDLGLGMEIYNWFLGEVDCVIYNQWFVNFNMLIEFFELYIWGVCNLVDFSRKVYKWVLVVFIFFIVMMDVWRKKELVLEKLLWDFDIFIGGYGWLKLISLLILEKVLEVLGVLSEIIWVGQIGGLLLEKGYWNRQEWLLFVVVSLVYMGLLFNSLGQMMMVDWVLIEGIVYMVLEVLGVMEDVLVDLIRGYFYGINFRKVQWGELVKVVKDFYGDRIKQIVLFEEWVK